MLKILHFADAHIDMANYGRHDPATGLPLRVLDFLKSLDAIVDAAIDERVDMVLFAGDAYKDRTPAPTFQREWGKRIMRLSRAGIPTLLLVGNHDLSPSLGRAHAIQEFDTLAVPHIHVASQPAFFGPDDLEGLPLQIIAIPWVSRSALIGALNLSSADVDGANAELEVRLTELVHAWLDRADPGLPVVMAAHASVEGATYGYERSVMLGSDLVLPGSLVKDPRLSYVALGHIHKNQDLNHGLQPPVVYPGSIERVDFGEARDDKFFVVIRLEQHNADVDWRRLSGIRRFIDCRIQLESADDISGQLLGALPAAEVLADAIVRMTIEYPREWEPLINDAELREHAAPAFEFHLIKRPQIEARSRLPQDRLASSFTPLELLDIFWSASHTREDEIANLQKLAASIIQNTHLEG
jgi:exonuclease SbcD